MASMKFDLACVNVLARVLTPASPRSLLKLPHFWLDNTNVISLAPFVKMVRVNCVLEAFNINPGTHALEKDDKTTKAWKEKTELQYLCKLNAAGRYQLLHQHHQSNDSKSESHTGGWIKENESRY